MYTPEDKRLIKQIAKIISVDEFMLIHDVDLKKRLTKFLSLIKKERSRNEIKSIKSEGCRCSCHTKITCGACGCKL